MKAGILTCTTMRAVRGSEGFARPLPKPSSTTRKRRLRSTFSLICRMRRVQCGLKLQREYKLTETCGFIPAALFYIAIMETSGKAAEDSNSPTIKQFFARGPKTLNRVNVSGSTTVDISSIRSMNVCFVGDSGCNLYSSKKVHPPGPQMREVGGWTNLCTDGIVGGTSIRHFGETCRTFALPCTWCGGDRQVP